MGRSNDPQPVDFDALRDSELGSTIRGDDVARVNDELRRLQNIERDVRGWLLWYDTGGGAGGTLNGIRQTLNDNEQEAPK